MLGSLHIGWFKNIGSFFSSPFLVTLWQADGLKADTKLQPRKFSFQDRGTNARPFSAKSQHIQYPNKSINNQDRGTNVRPFSASSQPPNILTKLYILKKFYVLCMYYYILGRFLLLWLGYIFAHYLCTQLQIIWTSFFRVARWVCEKNRPKI
jgi:hypothetical protein